MMIIGVRGQKEQGTQTDLLHIQSYKYMLERLGVE